jgi:hypothetical protein
LLTAFSSFAALMTASLKALSLAIVS